ncbi:type II toxin-antitoxin system Phd/YefM family antitoxin [Methylobacterium sp. J-067]|jgi:prevent-host-death family protein|uniref:type II toxin-antitoxin system Phd/YefM family antitoxin n=1 Tax=Methylobacterium sp. J-067 TaxID=2836648 RepID=UPI001FBB4739|nr:type II toxin-antitoxin system prevent-host-death family antitoxin [Methylobacterium sp. J-067]MCJ2026154.1 type II toxin-antitoxin system prevent-host-death family antitoxin [Methylobacterium sp. J-067]
MEKTISAAEANRGFSEILRGVRDGHSYVVTNHGRPVARIVPAERDDAARDAKKEALLERLRNQPLMNAGRWTREELYEDEP